jgi:hypothetical protein
MSSCKVSETENMGSEKDIAETCAIMAAYCRVWIAPLLYVWGVRQLHMSWLPPPTMRKTALVSSYPQLRNKLAVSKQRAGAVYLSGGNKRILHVYALSHC